MKTSDRRLVYIITSPAGKVRPQRYGYPIKNTHCNQYTPGPLPSRGRGLGMRLTTCSYMYMYMHVQCILVVEAVVMHVGNLGHHWSREGREAVQTCPCSPLFSSTVLYQTSFLVGMVDLVKPVW